MPGQGPVDTDTRLRLAKQVQIAERAIGQSPLGERGPKRGEACFDGDRVLVREGQPRPPRATVRIHDGKVPGAGPMAGAPAKHWASRIHSCATAPVTARRVSR